MAGFPMFVNLEGRRCLVVGGGSVAYRKICTLLKFDADVWVYARQRDDRVAQLADEGKIRLADCCCGIDILVDGAFLVVCATDDANFNHEVAKRCRELSIPVNCATGNEDSTFIFPAVVVREDMTVGISTDGCAPALTSHIRKELDAALPLWYGSLTKRLAVLREMVRERFDDVQMRSRMMNELTQYGLTHEGEITDEVFDEICSHWHQDL